jgi:FkbM family methyltransferase
MASPIQPAEADFLGWSERPSLVIAAGDWWARHFRRGRGKVPRTLGKIFGERLRRCMTTRHGAKLAMAPRSYDVYARMKLRGGAWEPQIFETCRSLLKPGDVFYDLGANVGYMSIETAVHFGGLVRCIAFEPQPDLARHIVVSAHLSGVGDAVAVFDAMIGEKPQRATIQLTSHSVHASAVAREKHAKPLEREMVSIDSLVEEGLAPPDVIKIDIEGGEQAAFLGAAEVIRKHAPHIVFEADSNQRRFGYNGDDLIRQLAELADYEFFDIDEQANLQPVVPGQLDGDVLARSKRRVTGG